MQSLSFDAQRNFACSCHCNLINTGSTVPMRQKKAAAMGCVCVKCNCLTEKEREKTERFEKNQPCDKNDVNENEIM